MRSRAVLVSVVLSTALVSGGWLVERGLAGRNESTDGARLFAEVFQRVSRDYVDTLSDSTLYQHAVEGMVDELHDPHSTYLSPALLARLSESTSGRYAGVGAQIDVRDGWITIVAPLAGGPALEAGVQTGDRIVEVDGKPTHDFSVEEAQKALRGPANSTVRLTVERPGVATPIKFALTRREIRSSSVQHAMLLGDGVGYVALTIFSEASAPDLKRAIDSLRTAGMTSLIFDLRGDPGGLLDQGVGVADLFLDPGQRIVSMKGRTEASTQTFTDGAPQVWPRLPVAVLVDSNSASAAEIVAGALQDHDRAVVLGTPTYGKGSAQNVFTLGDAGAVKLTTALWFTPSGRSIDKKRRSIDGEAPVDSDAPRPTYKTDAGRRVLGGGGITPDARLPRVAKTAADSAFDQALGTHVPQFRDVLGDYALSLRASRGVSSPDFAATPEMRAEVQRRLRSKGVVMDSSVFAAAGAYLDRLIGYDVARFVFGPEAEARRKLRDDPAVTSAVTLMRGVKTEPEALERARTLPGAVKE